MAKPELIADNGIMAKYDNPPIKSWSYSTISAFMGEHGCPYKLSKTKVEKLVEEENENLKRGIRVHQEAEDYVQGKIDTLPESLKLFEEDMNYLRDEFKNDWIYVEESWAFTKDWDETKWNDWSNCWLRVKMDLHFFDDKEDGVLTVIDYKTGKIRGEYMDQVELYALAAFMLYDEEDLHTVRGELWFFDNGTVVGIDDSGKVDKRYEFHRKDVDKLLLKWNKKANRVLSCTEFPAQKNNWCRFCHIHESKGGTCKISL